MADPRNELRRKAVHAGLAVPAFFLDVTGSAAPMMLAFAAAPLFAFIVPRVAPGLVRDEEARRGIAPAIGLYPLVVGLALWLLEPPEAAATWAVLGFGDAAGSLVGRRWPLARLRWNPRKSLGGSLAVFAAASSAGYAAASACDGSTVTIGAVAVASVGAALAESLDVRLDDNARMPVVFGSLLLALR